MTVAEYKCPSCGGYLAFDARTQQFECPFCSSVFDAATFAPQGADAPSVDVEHGERAARRVDALGNEAAEGAYLAYSCPSCGGEIVGDDTVAATRCPYCDNPAVVPGQISGTFAPDLVVPFKTTREDAKAAFARTCKGRWLLPNGFANQQRLDEIVGLYVPFWLFDCSVEGVSEYEAYNESHQGQDTLRTHFAVKRGGAMSFANVPADASTLMDDTMMESIEPFDCSEARPFSSAYLAGFVANRYDVDPAGPKERVRVRAEQSLKAKLRNTVSYKDVGTEFYRGECAIAEPRYALLPVWTLASRFGGKTYRFTMNGQTGKFTGSLPVDNGKLALLFAVAFAVGCALGLLFTGLGGGTPNFVVGAVLGALVGAVVAFVASSSMNSHQPARGSDAYAAGDFALTCKEDVQVRTELIKAEQPAAAQPAAPAATPAAHAAQPANRLQGSKIASRLEQQRRNRSN